MRRGPVEVEVDGSIFILRGWYPHRLAIAAGLRPTYSGVRQGWMADTSKLANFEAYCAHRRVPLDVQCLDVEKPASSVLLTEDVESDEPLFDLGGR